MLDMKTSDFKLQHIHIVHFQTYADWIMKWKDIVYELLI